MAGELIGKKPHFRQSRVVLNPYRIMLLIGLIIAAVWLLQRIQRGAIRPVFEPTPTPTRSAASYIEEAEAYFQAGKLFDPDPAPPAPPHYDAIDTYQRALQIDPNNADAWAKLARIQAYSSTVISNDKDRNQRLNEARQSIDKALELAPDNSNVRAIRAFVLDWNASSPLVGETERQDLLAQAQTEALQAFQLNQNNALALAFYAEVLLDQQNWSQAEQYAAQAVKLDPLSMDAHRVYGTVLESTAQYNGAIKEYLKATEINPNLTFLYVYIGRNYLRLKLYDRALEFFARAANINMQLGVRDPLPNLEIARTYTQQGEFFIAARNAERALSYDPTNASTYGQLGIIMLRARNYEGALPVLKCAVKGCTAEENEMAQNLVAEGLLESSVAVEGLPLTNITVAYDYVEYGTVLAFLSRPNQNYCPEARQVLGQVKAQYSYDPIITGIIADSEGICNRLESGQIFSTTSTPVISPIPINTAETTITPTP